VTKRDYCINELVETEKNYIEALAMIINVCVVFNASLVVEFIDYCNWFVFAHCVVTYAINHICLFVHALDPFPFWVAAEQKGGQG